MTSGASGRLGVASVRAWSRAAAGTVVAVLLVVAGCTTDSVQPPAPDTQGWTRLSPPPISAPVLRVGQAAVWTGRQALLWGGSSPRPDGCAVAVAADGAAWTPAAGAVTGADADADAVADATKKSFGGRWYVLPPAPVAARSGAQFLWTGSEAVLVGGVDPWAECESRPAGQLDVASYTPNSSPSYTPSSTAPGGVGDDAGDDAGDGGIWRRLPDLPWPAGTVVAASTWAAGQVLVWSPTVGAWSLRLGETAWTPLPPAPLPASAAQPAQDLAVVRASVHSIWTQREWLLMGTSYGAGGAIDIGLAFDPVSGVWRQINPGPLRDPGTGMAWSGREILAFGPDHALNRYDVSTNAWSARNAGPLQLTSAQRGAPVVVWAGSRLVVWGGARQRDAGMCIDSFDPAETEYGGVCNPATGPLGATYDVASDSWREFSDGPWQRRVGSAAVWMGDRLLLSGGRDLEVDRRGGGPVGQDDPKDAVVVVVPPAGP